MAKSRRRRLAATVVSIAAVASSLSAPAAFAQDACIKCEPPDHTGNASEQAFLKIGDLGFPGNTQFAFLKLDRLLLPAVHKLSELGWPGNTQQAFFPKVEFVD